MYESDSLTGATSLAGLEASSAPDPARDVLVLFDECGPRLLRYVGSFGLRRHDTEDVVQDVFLSLYRHLELGRPRTNLRGWLFRVAHNLALRHRQRQKRHAVLDAVRAATMIDPAANPEETLAETRQHVRLAATLQALPERDRACLLLRAEGLRYREIAVALNMSLGGIAKSLARSLTVLGRADRR